MDHTENLSPAPESDADNFPHYTLEEVVHALELHQVDTLKWFENADGTPHENIGRIYVRMHDPALDVVVQTDRADGNGKFTVFPASNWQKGTIDEDLADTIRDKIQFLDEQELEAMNDYKTNAVQSREEGNLDAAKCYEQQVNGDRFNPKLKLIQTLHHINRISTNQRHPPETMLHAPTPHIDVARSRAHEGKLHAPSRDKGPDEDIWR